MNVEILNPVTARLNFDSPTVVASTHLLRVVGSTGGTYTLKDSKASGIGNYIDLTVTTPFVDGETVTVSYPNYSALEDNFTDSDSTLLANHTPDSGGAWAGNTSAWSILNNALTCSSNNVNVRYAAGSAGDRTTTWWINPDHTDTGVSMRLRLCGRITDQNNYWSLEVRIVATTGVKEIYLAKVEGGVATTGTATTLEYVAETSFQVDLEDEWVRVQCVDDGTDQVYSLPDWGYSLSTSSFSAGDRSFLSTSANVGMLTLGTTASSGPYRVGRILVE